jgi:hypothetical protein
MSLRLFCLWGKVRLAFTEMRNRVRMPVSGHPYHTNAACGSAPGSSIVDGTPITQCPRRAYPWDAAMLSIDRPVLEMCYLLGLADPGRSSGEKRNAWSIVLSETVLVLVIESRQP